MAGKAAASKSGPFSFHASIMRLSGAYFVEVPARVSAALGAGRVPVVAQLDAGEPFHGTLMPSGGGRHRLMVNDRARHGAVSGRVAVALRVNDPLREVPIPEDLAAALDEAQARASWESMPPGKREHICAWIERAARESTREKRIAVAVEAAEQRREKAVDRARSRRVT